MSRVVWADEEHPEHSRRCSATSSAAASSNSTSTHESIAFRSRRCLDARTRSGTRSTRQGIPRNAASRARVPSR